MHTTPDRLFAADSVAGPPGLGAPPVIGAEPEDTAEPDTAQLSAFLPSRPFRPGDREVDLELRHTDGGHLALLVFSSLEALATNCGPAQPWVAVPADLVAEIGERTGADVVLWDHELPAELRHTTH